MIPLQTTIPVKKFPWGTVSICLFLFFAELLSYIWPGDRSEFLLKISFVPANFMWSNIFAAAIFFPHLFSFFIQLLFVWVFTPRLLERRGFVFLVLAALSGVLLSVLSFRAIHFGSSAPMLLSDALVGVWLGAYMRRDIWGTVNTLVVGPGWIRVLEVPSYVQLFFWFFYQLISNLFLPSVLANAPMLYWIGLSSFLWGFLLDSMWGVLFAHRNTAT